MAHIAYIVPVLYSIGSFDTTTYIHIPYIYSYVFPGRLLPKTHAAAASLLSQQVYHMYMYACMWEEVIRQLLNIMYNTNRMEWHSFLCSFLAARKRFLVCVCSCGGGQAKVFPISASMAILAHSFVCSDHGLDRHPDPARSASPAGAGAEAVGLGWMDADSTTVRLSSMLVARKACTHTYIHTW